MDLTKPRVVIVGGGFAGVAAARALRGAEANVVLIDKHNHHLFQPLLYQVATAALHPGTIAAPIRSLVSKQANCRVLMKEVNGVDVDTQTVDVGGEPYIYDYLLLATGFETNYFGNESWKKYAPGMKTIDEATDVRARFLLAFEQAEFEQDEAAKRAALTFAIVGAGPHRCRNGRRVGRSCGRHAKRLSVHRHEDRSHHPARLRRSGAELVRPGLVGTGQARPRVPGHRGASGY